MTILAILEGHEESRTPTRVTNVRLLLAIEAVEAAEEKCTEMVRASTGDSLYA